ncbi:hypothetical protein FPOAC2_08677 [Fusarium poae]|uniref:Uncharacterized protein n=1 Tax=Fusarium poae TaxID=36050 RepID=A0A1B8ALV5_FUSPO|nr:hypothetical protein FPOAC1_008746 [Fusarium poae]KAG8669353.1 hypothetical protein FPOAC1_008746 [Fusarium poae]OBS21579.1 hypothetical protein FPOA_07915 [Fusarium poae]
MRSSKSPSKRKATEGSPKFGYTSSTDFENLPTQRHRQDREDSYFWMGRYLATDTPSPIGDDQTPLQATMDNVCEFNLNRRNVQRGDVHPVEHRPLVMIPKHPPVAKKPAISDETNRKKTGRQERQSKKQKTPQSEPEPPTVHSQLPTPDFESVIWPAMWEKVQSLIKAKVSEHMEAMLQERKAELESLTRPPLLKADSSPEVYLTYVQFLKNRIKATTTNSSTRQKTEAVMSLAMDLEPGIEKCLRKHLGQITAEENIQVESQDLAMAERERIEEEELDTDDEDIITISDKDDSDYQDDPEDVDEPLTPVTTPTTMSQLKRYEDRFREFRRYAASESVSNDKKRALEKTPTPTKAGSKRRCTVRHSPGFTPSPASSKSSYFPSLQELFSSSLGRQSSPATQPSPSRSQPSTRQAERAQHESTLPTRFRETTADFEAMNTSEKLLLLFKMSRGKEK